MANASLRTIPARHGAAVSLGAGEAVMVVNTHGGQVVDTWAFDPADPSHHLSMEHTRVETSRFSPRPGDVLFSNRREPMLSFEADSSAGVHDTIMAACDRRRYERLGCSGYHRNCADNLVEALAGLGVSATRCPQPLNLFMNIPLRPDGTLVQGEPLSKPGDSVTLRALVDCIVVFSACPQDVTPINGGAPVDAHFRILPALPPT